MSALRHYVYAGAWIISRLSKAAIRINVTRLSLNHTSPYDVSHESTTEQPIKIPHAELSTEALLGVIESFVLREGTDYGAITYTLAEKVERVRNQLEHGDAVLVYDPNTRTIDIIVTGEIRSLDDDDSLDP